MDVLDYLERSITDEDNVILTAPPTIQEVKDSVLSIDPDSAPDPDGLSGCFYQSTWDVIANDLHMAVVAVFSGATLLKYFTHTCIMMIPKVQHPQKFDDLRPISLCNVSSKVISKVINTRLLGILLRIISKNQSGFVKWRATTENILLAQEILNDIKKPNRGKNVVINLDMTKAYDRVSWSYLCQALRNMGFSDEWTWFLQVRKRSEARRPLSPSLFILSAELLSQMLNKLQNSLGHKGFYMKNYGPQINHLTFADDTILFCNGSKKSLRKVVNTLKEYELISGQLINKSKSNFSMDDNTDVGNIVRVQQATGTKKLAHFSGIIDKIINRIRGWHTNLLSTGGRAVLIRHVLLDFPIPLLSAVHPLKRTLETIEKYMARFLWSGQDSGGKHHWVSWENICFPYQEGGSKTLAKLSKPSSGEASEIPTLFGVKS
ncbi:uncharacterized protein LOC132612715 [Lycium barbarum]|uniref:uncharacterized protein LOC132612715 n=1 Tax=Lycium barbarum TaxID=112863 RepID=UPI00293F5158|nr:uncharacterized protein LOC132612715 [Lycium barbarum]